MDLQGKSIAITGGSSGLGTALVEQAAHAGAKVVFSYNSGKDRAREVGEKYGAKYSALDLGIAVAPTGFLMGEFGQGGIDYFIANAGVEFSGDLKKHTPREIHRVVTTNLVGNLFLLQALIDGGYMAKGGQIAVIGSIAADGNHDQMAYSASKAGLRGAVECLSRYDQNVREQGLGIKLLEPAFIKTPMAERIIKLIERRVIPKKGGDALLNEFRESGLVMEPSYAAQRILELTVNPKVTGRRTIPEGVSLHQVREKYF